MGRKFAVYKLDFITADVSRSHYVDLIYRKNPAAEHDDIIDKSCSKYSSKSNLILQHEVPIPF